MSMHGTASVTVSDAARALVKAALGDSPVIVVDDLKGDAAKGEPVSNGTFTVVDETHPTFGDVVRNRVVKLGDNVVFGPILVAAADKLTHAKAENMLRSFATMGGWPVRPVREKAPKPDDLDEQPSDEERAQLVEHHLDEMDAWRSGAKATPGQPAGGERYALSMRENIKRHAAALRELGHSVDDVGNPLPA